MIWQDRKGRAWTLLKPKSVAQVLALEEAAIPIRAQVHREQPITGDALRTLHEGIAPHLRLGQGEVCADALDELLSTDEVLTVLSALFDMASLDKQTLDHLERAFAIRADGGCECPRCEGKQIKGKVPCKFDGLDAHIWSIIQRAVMFEHASLDMPWWLYQAVEISKRSFGRKHQEQIKKIRQTEKNREIDQLLKRNNLWG